MTSRMLSRHAPQFQLTLPSRSLQPVAVVSTPSPADMKAAASAAASSAAEGWRHPLRCATTTTTIYNENTTNNTAASTHCKKMYSGFDASEIFHNLFLGSWIDADSIEDLKARNVKRILNVAEECPVSSSCEAAMACGSIRVKKLFLKDHSDEDIAMHLPEALEFVHEGILHGEGVLVHCRQGVSRSATIVLAYLMQFGIQGDAANHAPRGPMSYADAFDFVKEKRPLISPNLGFVLALHEVERAAHHQNSSNNNNHKSSVAQPQQPQPLSACA